MASVRFTRRDVPLYADSGTQAGPQEKRETHMAADDIRSTLILSATEVRQLLCMGEVIEAVEGAFKACGEGGYWRKAYAGLGGGDAASMWTFGDINFAKIAEELGCLGIRVERPEDVRAAVERGLASGRPTLVDVATDPDAVADKGWG